MGFLGNLHAAKKVSVNEPENFRTVYLVSCMAKFFTQVLADRLIAWMNETEAIPEFQSGFRRGRGEGA